MSYEMDIEIEDRLRRHYAQLQPESSLVADARLIAALDDVQAAPRDASAGWPLFARLGGALAVIVLVVAVAVSFSRSAYVVGDHETATGPATQSSATPVDTTHDYADLAGVAADGTIWAVRGSTLFVSGDQAASWRKASLPTTQPNPIPPYGTFASDLFALDDLHFWWLAPGPGSTGQTGDQARDKLSVRVYRTSDGGKSWSEADVEGNYPDSTPMVTFANASDGFLTILPSSGQASTILRTTDGGATWSIATSAPVSKLVATSAGTLWGIATQSASVPLLMSRDAAETWSGVELPDWTWAAGLGKLSSVVAFSDRSVVAVGNSVVYGSADAGATWSEVSIPWQSGGNFAVVDPTTWIVVSQGGTATLHSTQDAGKTWTETSPAGLPNGNGFSRLYFADPSHGVGLVIADPDVLLHQALYHTNDGGLTWQPVDLDSPAQ